ncbi:hypothetical protein BY996DRAFT_7601885, partial [Phakopsora pachyrhizi]
MRSFIYCALIVLLCQFATSLTIIERSEVGSYNEESSEKQFPRPPPPPPPHFGRPPPPPPPFGRPPPPPPHF